MRHNLQPFRRADVIPHGDTEPVLDPESRRILSLPLGCNGNCNQGRACDCAASIDDKADDAIGSFVGLKIAVCIVCAILASMLVLHLLMGTLQTPIDKPAPASAPTTTLKGLT